MRTTILSAPPRAYRRVMDGLTSMDGVAKQPVVLAANLGLGRPPNGQTVKAREVLEVLRRTGRDVQVLDVGAGLWHLMRLPGSMLRGRTSVVMLNRKGLWVALGLVAATAAVRRRRPPVLVAVVGGWLPSYLARHRWCRVLSQGVDEFWAETDDLVRELSASQVEARQLVNFRDLQVHRDRVATRPITRSGCCSPAASGRTKG